jgi:hypothetical protein
MFSSSRCLFLVIINIFFLMSVLAEFPGLAKLQSPRKKSQARK